MSGGANCPETPRQKMIGMMYLFLTAMLALNISKDILNAFVVVNEGLEATNGNFAVKNNQTMNSIDFAYQNDKIKVKKSLDAAKATQKASAELIVYIDNLKKEIINITDLGRDQIDAMYGDTVNLMHVKGKDNNVPSTYYFMGGSVTTGEKSIDGPEGKAPEFRKKLQDYVAELKGLLKGLDVKGVDKLGDFGVNTSDPVEQSIEHPEENHWASSNFYHIPLAAEVAILSQIENQVRNAEATVMNRIMGSIGATDMKFDELEARVIPKSTYVIQGSDYEADLFVAAWSSTSNPKVIVGPANMLDTVKWEFKPGADTTICPVIDGVGKYKIKASSLGNKKYASIIEVKNTQTGELKTYPLQVEGNYYSEYMVAKPSAVISPTKMNVFYIGVTNPVSVSVPGFANENISVSGLRVKNKAKGQYTINPKKRGKIKIRVTATDAQGNKVSFPPQEFRVKRVPPPIAKVGGKSSGKLSRNKIIAAGGIQSKMENFDFELSTKVVSYTVSMKIGQYTKDTDVRGGSFRSIESQLKKLKRGQRVTFVNIKAKVAGSVTKLAPISFKIN